MAPGVFKWKIITSLQCDQMVFIEFILCPITTVKNCTILYKKNTKVSNICQILINPHKIAKDILVYAKFGHTASLP